MVGKLKKLKKIRIILFLWYLAMHSIIYAQTVIPGGYVSGIWNPVNSPYLVEDNILIHADSTLAIDAGTTILFSSNKLLEIQGQLLVYGTEDNPVYFDGGQDTTTWYGLFFNTTDTSITDSSILENSFIIHCAGHPSLTIEQSNRVRLSAITVRYGDSFRGGGISCIASDIYFEDILVEQNAALDGGGVSLENSSPVMKNCTISQNVAYGAGGGMVIFDGSDPVLTGCIITENTSAGSGGGIYINASDPVFRNCIISNNEGATGASNLYSGGGVSVKLASHPVFENCIFESNVSHREGGGIASFSENEIVNCLFQGNTALVRGGGAFLSAANLLISHVNNCTFSDNDSPQGTALASHNHNGVLRNCILWHSNPSNPSSLIYLESNFGLNGMNAGYSDIQNGEEGIEVSGTAGYIWSQGNIDFDPIFLPGMHVPDWQSPCIEAGTPDTSGLNLPESDLGGNPRLANERVDMGAYEYQLPLGVQSSKFKIQSEALLYPNPAQDWIVVDFGFRIHNARFQVISVDGGVLLEGESASGNSFRIDLKDLSDGIYFIVIRTNENIFSEKFVVNRLLHDISR
jgi:parallel beta-helix repeat protein